MAAARAMALADGKPLYRWLAPDESLLRLPVPHFNVVNGGAHAQNDLELQEFMLAPLGAPNFAEALRAGAEVYQALRGLLARRQGIRRASATRAVSPPNLGTPEEVLDLLVEAISGRRLHARAATASPSPSTRPPPRCARATGPTGTPPASALPPTS